MRRLSLKPAAAILIAAATPGMAQVAAAPQPSTDVARLSPEDREAALEAGAAQAATRDLPINGLSRGVHGEMGMEIGSRGERALYGSAALPLGDTGSAQFSFFTGNSGRWRVR